MDLTTVYAPREWKVYEVRIDSEYPELCSILTKTQLQSCGSDSEMAQNYFRRNGTVEGLFFYDTEQLFMELDKTCYGEMCLGVLTREWRGHPAGSLVFVITKGVYEGKLTVGVAKDLSSIKKEGEHERRL